LIGDYIVLIDTTKYVLLLVVMTLVYYGDHIVLERILHKTFHHNLVDLNHSACLQPCKVTTVYVVKQPISVYSVQPNQFGPSSDKDFLVTVALIIQILPYLFSRSHQPWIRLTIRVTYLLRMAEITSESSFDPTTQGN